MGERLKPAVLKTVSPERGSGVRIPLPPPLFLYRALKFRASFLLRQGLAFPWGFYIFVNRLRAVRISGSSRC